MEKIMSETSEQIFGRSGVLNMIKDIQAKFVEHPNEKSKGYVVHLIYAWATAAETATYALMLVIHGVFPFWFQTSGTDGIKKMAKEFEGDVTTKD
jgi:hypothetical protein